MWIGEWEPEQAWLYLVAAIEAVSRFVVPPNISDGDLLLEYHPNIAKPIAEAGGQELLEKLGKRLRHLIGSMRRFCEFIVTHLPEPPKRRPPSYQLTWSGAGLKPVLKIIYDHRSRALHDGTPFPLPMCEQPPRFEGWPACSDLSACVRLSSARRTFEVVEFADPGSPQQPSGGRPRKGTVSESGRGDCKTSS